MALTIDIIDDDEAVRDSTRALLESYGYTVRDYPSAEQYLTRRSNPPGDCMLVDQHMPGMTGLELLEALRAQGEETPALILTGRNDPTLAPRIAKAGVFKLLHKPIQDDQLVHWIEEAHQNGAHPAA